MEDKFYYSEKLGISSLLWFIDSFYAYDVEVFQNPDHDFNF
jgi:hypothetical protein